MLRLLPGTLAIFATHLFLVAVFCGIGLMIRRAFGLRSVSVDDVLLAFWMGLGACLVFLLDWNFLFPVNAAALAIVVVAGLLGLAIAIRTAEPSADRWRPSTGTLVVLGLLALWIANASLRFMDAWDTSLYHMQSVRWARDFRAAPGLANLFGPLGFNSTSILYDAMLDHWPWTGRAWHIVNGPPILAATAAAVFGAARFRIDDTRPASANLFHLLLLAPVLNLVFTGASAASFRTDIIVTLIIITIMSRWYALETRRRADAQARSEDGYETFGLVVLCGVAVSIKMNSAVFGALAAATIAVTARLRVCASARLLVSALALDVAIIGMWMARSVVLSGYPLFPSRVLAMPVDWRVSAMHAQAEYDYVVASGRGIAGAQDVVSGKVTGLGAWVPLWLHHVNENWHEIVIPAGLVVILLMALAAAWRRSDATTRASARPGWILLVPLLGTLFAWFLVAPEPRYASPQFWSLAALIAAEAYLLHPGRRRPGVNRAIVAMAWVLGLSTAVVEPLRLWARRPVGNPIVALIRADINVPPQGEHFGGGASPHIQKFETRSGLLLSVPEARCWDVDPPCTPNPAPNLRLRVPGDLAGGFVADGAWQMIDWPYKWRPGYLPAWRESIARRGLELHGR